MIEERKYCVGILKKQFDKELAMTKKDNEDFDYVRICDHVYVEGDVKLRDQCHITGKYRGSAHRNCNINVKLNHKILIVFCNLKNYDSNFIMQELGKFGFLNTCLTKWIKIQEL